jgi:hypothetical protein
MKDLLSIRQTTDVLEYANRFEQARHRVLVHNKGIDEVFFVQKFLDGLNYNIGNAFQLHKPRTVDDALSLALMQEQLLEAASRRYTGRSREPRYPGRSYTPPEQKLPTEGILSPTPTLDKQQGRSKWEDRVSALRAARNTKGLCMKCGEVYSPQHKCPKQVPLHVLEELWEMMDLNQDKEEESEEDEDSDVELLQLSLVAAHGTKGKKTIRLQGLINHQEVLILVDSGSSGTFLNSDVVEKLQLPTKKVPAVQVAIAGGAKLTTDSAAEALIWWTQGHTFITDARVLSLGAYDMVLGMDWIEAHSPMWVHWQRKRMKFSHQGKRITLKVVKDCTAHCKKLTAKKLHGLVRKGAVSQVIQLSPQCKKRKSIHVPAEIKTLFQSNEDLFREPQQLSPQRSFDHSIPLVQGVKPVNIKPYHYSPEQKDEIEAQIKHMLQHGIIQPSTSPFASPVLLVKKKDDTWRFCVDYRHLNAITIKNKYPLPVVVELLDELHVARWFTKLDLRSGYHQIRVLPEDEIKTTFKTHNGHWQFEVMPFGLTNAPATFQGIMNTIFAEQLRKYVLVFVDDILIYNKSLEAHQHHLQQVFQILRSNQLFIKKRKCTFAQSQLEYLGHIIG